MRILRALLLALAVLATFAGASWYALVRLPQLPMSEGTVGMNGT